MMIAPLPLKHPHISAFIILSIVTLAIFADVLFTARPVILSREGTDLSQQFVYWRDFGFSELRNGRLPLWNPHIFSGTPFLGGFQSALLYPPNILFVVLPLCRGINWSIALHVFLIGFFMYLWASRRGLHFYACLLSSSLLMFCGAHFLHIYAGHLPNLCAMAWTPLLFLSVDRLFERVSLGGILLGVFAVTMQILAGHPQYFFYTALAILIYSAPCLIRASKRGRIILAILGIYIGGLLLSAAQVLTGIEATGESVRSLGVPSQFAATFSFPPENFLTLFTPSFFGDLSHLPYWGRWYLWEMSLFIGLTGLVLTVFGALSGSPKVRRFSTAMVFILLLLALGAYTPLFQIFYALVPGFNKFRGTSKFIFQASLFLTLLAGVGADHLLKAERLKKKYFVAAAILGILIGGLFLGISGLVKAPASDLWKGIVRAEGSSRQTYLPPQVYADDRFVEAAGHSASRSLLFATGTIILILLLLALSTFYRPAVYGILLLAFVEIFAFAKAARPDFNYESTINKDFIKFLSEHPGDYRTLNLLAPNSGMSTGALDIWGLDPGVPRRYAEFMALTQGQNPEDATQDVAFKSYHPLFKMLRCRYVISRDQGKSLIREIPDVLPHVLLIQDWQVKQGRGAIFSEMLKPDFDPRRTVVLEETPDPLPGKSSERATCSILQTSTDSLGIQAQLSEPAVLLITDSYSKGWRATAMPGSAQTHYRIMPADYILMAIPLSAGNHVLALQYKPRAFSIGQWVSICGALIYLALLAFSLYGFFRKASSRKPQTETINV